MPDRQAGRQARGALLLTPLLLLDAGTFQVGFPSTFLSLERFKPALAPMLDSTRPMDNMALDFDLPQEDELATNVLSGKILLFAHY